MKLPMSVLVSNKTREQRRSSAEMTIDSHTKLFYPSRQQQIYSSKLTARLASHNRSLETSKGISQS